MTPKNFKIPTPPFRYQNPTQAAEQSANLTFALFSGGEAIGFEQIVASDSEEKKLNPPEGTVWALLVCEKNPAYAGTASVLLRFRQDKTLVAGDLTATKGMPLCELGVIEIKDVDNLKRFSFIATAPNSAILNVEYYS